MHHFWLVLAETSNVSRWNDVRCWCQLGHHKISVETTPVNAVIAFKL